jgi:hypothetical protein
MVDAGLDPAVIEKRLNNQGKENITCMNFGLTGAQAAISSDISRTLVNWNSTDLILYGVSPIEFDEREKDSRQMANAAVFQKSQKFNLENWLFNTFRLPWFYYGLLNRKDKDFIRTEQSYDSMLNSHGFRISDKLKGVDTKNQEFYLHDFYINPVDLDALDEMIKSMQEKEIKVIVFEMPVRPAYFPLLIEGGSTMYDIRFIEPIEKLLERNDLSLIRTQPLIESKLGDEYWMNENHLNYAGSQIFTNILADQILQRGDW